MTYRIWDRPDYPTWSLPAQEAGKCAAAQGTGAFERLHLALFAAFFARGRNIAEPDEVVAVARETGLDMARFTDDFRAGRFREAVLDEYREAHERYGITAIPTVFFASAAEGAAADDAIRITGAVPAAEYERVLTEHFGLRPLAGQP